jgi:MFS family permease
MKRVKKIVVGVVFGAVTGALLAAIGVLIWIVSVRGSPALWWWVVVGALTAAVAVLIVPPFLKEDDKPEWEVLLRLMPEGYRFPALILLVVASLIVVLVQAPTDLTTLRRDVSICFLLFICAVLIVMLARLHETGGKQLVARCFEMELRVADLEPLTRHAVWCFGATVFQLRNKGKSFAQIAKDHGLSQRAIEKVHAIYIRSRAIDLEDRRPAEKS